MLFTALVVVLSCLHAQSKVADVTNIGHNTNRRFVRRETPQKDKPNAKSEQKDVTSVSGFEHRLLNVEALGKKLSSRQKSTDYVVAEFKDSNEKTSDMLNIMRQKLDQMEIELAELKTCQCQKMKNSKTDGEGLQNTEEDSGDTGDKMFQCSSTAPENTSDHEDWNNVALNKPAVQSSTHSSTGLASHAVDGNRASSFWSNSCTHTFVDGSDIDPWWQVDLQREYTVTSVKITNRGDCCAFRMRNFTIELHQCDPTTNVNTFPQLCYWQTGELGRGTVKISCNVPTTGRYLRIKKHNRNPVDSLTLCEVQVQAQRSTDNQSPPKNLGPSNNLGRMTSKNIALGRPTIQSSTMTGVPSRAVDNNVNTDWSGQSCTHTSVYDVKPYWQVDLQTSYEVTRVNITNRADCCAERLSNFKVEVYRENPVMNKKTQPQLCKHHRGRVSAGATVALTCNSPVIGQFVRISKNTLYLTLCEVTVEGRRL